MLTKKMILALGTTLLMVGCGTGVKLDNVPVEDRTIGGNAGQNSGQAGGTQGTDASTMAKSAVAPLELNKAQSTDSLPASSRLVYFDYDSFLINPEFQSLIESNARLIKADKNRKVAIEGHTDDRGGREYNLALGQKRAEAVRRALALQGVADSQMEAVSFGKEKPAATGSDEASMAKNRRAEISYR